MTRLLLEQSPLPVPLGASIPRLAADEFERLRNFIHRVAGIHLAPAKRGMAESRLLKRIEELGLDSFGEYCDLVMGSCGSEELPALLDRITTNKTDFYREPGHFDFLTRSVIPGCPLIEKTGARRPLDVWSAGCSTGEEPYTIAMALSEYAGMPSVRFTFRIVATDLSTRVLEVAQRAVYTDEQAAPIPEPLRRKYLLRSKKQDGMVRICPILRALVEFRQLNFMDSQFGFAQPFDVIFCRNVMIYFNRETIARLVRRFIAQLRPGGFLLIGHSESLHGIAAGLEPVAPAIYRKVI